MIFVDTGAFIARHWRPDRFHDRAVAFWKELLEAGTPLATTPQVVAEILDFFAYEAPPVFAKERARRLMASVAAGEIALLRPTEAEEQAALSWFERTGGKAWRRETEGRRRKVVSWTDCTSFAIMVSRGLDTAFTFDGDFHAAGFKIYGEP